jgi:hypothetical protein
MKLKDILNESIINEGFMPIISQPKIKLKGKDGKSETLQWKVSVSSQASYGDLYINFEPKGIKTLRLALEMEQVDEGDYLTSGKEKRVLHEQLAKWTQSKLGYPAKPLSGVFKAKFMVEVSLDKLIKKLK